MTGDTANKIGTYSLALCASHHGIPFLVAAPLTSIDLSISSGKEIVIEERSPKEVLHARGGLGEQVAASGISVWNPAFDVTPAHIISGIITEKVSLSLSLSLSVSLSHTYTHTQHTIIGETQQNGNFQGVITKNGTEEFDIKGFVERASSKP